ncbi:unnamed protein product [Durusdinium trenchii]|uniref:Uncharacterized protein n=1 Tax=Durusdinium trenchii TaxID=1381693 RepID=A0ABP0I4N6_9DINO
MANAAPPSGIRNDVLLPDAVKDYIIEHKLEKVVTTALNRVILQMPEDPYARLAEELSKSSFSVPRFAHLRPDASRARNRLTFHVVVASHGVNIRIHSITMGEAITVEEGTEERWLAFLQDFFQKSFGNLHVDEYISLEEHIGDLTGAPGPLEAPKVGLSLCNQLLLAAAASTNLDVLAFLQHCLIKVGCEQVSPPLRKPEDVSAWRHRWPSFAVPLFHGGHGGHLPKLRCAAALRALPEEAEPSLGMLAQLLEALHTAKVEAVKGLQADKTTASLVVEGVAHVMPTFHQTFQASQEERPAQLERPAP